MVLLEILNDIESGKITSTSQILKLIAIHSKSGKFQAFTKQSLGMALVASGELADQGNSSKPCFLGNALVLVVTPSNVGICILKGAVHLSTLMGRLQERLSSKVFPPCFLQWTL